MSNRIVIAGGTGFLGRPLSAALAAQGHDVVVLTRGQTRMEHVRTVTWIPDGNIGPWTKEIDGAAAVVNLAGESIAAKRWTSAQKLKILDSRVSATRSLVSAIRLASSTPPVFISGSAVGYYGPCGDEVVTEDTRAGTDFLGAVCTRWEREASPAASDRTRLIRLRTGLVLAMDGGALPQMLPPFKFGAGGPVGSGRQYWPWIHRDDWVALVCWAIRTPALSGAVNATAPSPVTNAEFATALGRAMHRPSFMPAPGFALRLLLGEMAEGLLLSGQRAVPQQAERAGFAFRFPIVSDALKAIFNGS